MRIARVSDTFELVAAQLALAREYGFASWPKLTREVAADPNLRDDRGRTALDRASPEHRYLDNPDHEAVAAILRPLTTV